MTQFIRITDPKAGPAEPRRLNSFPGRYLSEREFELLQAYVDDRIAPLVTGLPAGIVSGLEVRPEGSGSNTILHIQPGVAVGAGGRLMRLFYPLKQAWPEFAELMERQLDNKLRDGFYFLTLHAVVEEVDKNIAQEPCTRTEPDPLRERRLETVILPSLQFISANPRLLAMSQARAANRICVRFLNESPHDPKTGAVPVALLKVSNKTPQWIDTVAGRYLSEPDAAYRTFLAHNIGLLEQWQETNHQGDTHYSLATILGVDYLPAASPLPPKLLQDPAGNQPVLAFHPADLQVELAPVPASTIGAVIERELPRGTVDLVHGQGDRIRLLLAIPDLDYRPTLMDLPQRDIQLEDELFRREEAAALAWKARWMQWQLLFRGLDTDQLKLAQAPREIDRPVDPDNYRYDLVKQRLIAIYGNKIEFPESGTIDPQYLESLCEIGYCPPEPYSSHLFSPHNVAGYTKVATPSAPAEQLLLQREGIRGAIKTLTRDLDESFRLLNEMNDYLNLQRQHLDSLTVSFSVLAGGVAGDGSGNSMMRWNGAVAFDTTVKEITKG